MCAAVFYSATNLCLRHVAVPNDTGFALLATSFKAFPAALLGWSLVIWSEARGRIGFPPRRALPLLIGAGLLMQFFGNVPFQIALGLGGLVLTVPVTFAVLIATGAWLGRLILHDPITTRTSISIAILIASISLLAIGAPAAAGSVARKADFVTVASACGIAALAGLGYGINGVVMRYVLQKWKLPLATTLVLFSTTGVAVPGLLSILLMGWTRIAETPPGDLGWMLLGGTCNAIAFFAIGAALARISVNRVNLINASQNAMCSIGGILFFAEPVTGPLAAGCLLTIIGIGLMDRRPPTS